MADWNFHNPVRLLFGRGVRAGLVEELSGFRGVVVTTARGRQQLENDPILCEVFISGTEWAWVDNVQSNPDIESLDAAISRLQDHSSEVILAFGGGSAIDSAKVLSVALARQRSNVRALLAESAPARDKAVPVYAVPTTAGTGSEVTPFATVWDHVSRRKHSLAGPGVYPHSAIVDPALTDGLPEAVTLSTGLDAINQAAESIWNRNMSPLSELVAGRALEQGFKALPSLMQTPDDSALRDAMAETSLLAGMAISQTRTSLCHSISYPLTAHFGVPHGLACAFTMPAVLRHNLPGDDGRFMRLARVLTGKEEAGHRELVELFDQIHHELKVAKRVREYIEGPTELLALRDEMFTPGRADNSLVSVDKTEIERILWTAWKPNG